MSKNHDFGYRMIIIMLSVILVITLVQSPRTTQAAPQAGGGQMTVFTVFEIYCTHLENVTQTNAELADLGTFTVHSSDSLLELTYNGRIFMNYFNSGSTGAQFELRVDGVASSLGRARAVLNGTEFGLPAEGTAVSITGIFSGLPPGNHTANMWVQSFNGTANGAWLNPSCWETDVLIVEEHLPFGVSFLPMITK